MNTPASTFDKRVNGVRVRSFFETLDTIRRDPALGHFQFRAHNQWLDGVHTRSTIKGLYGAGAEQHTRDTPFVVETDLPGVLEGGEHAPSPVELLLAALGSCVTTTLVSQAAIRNIHLDSVDVRVAGDIDMRGFLGLSEHRKPAFGEIRVSVRLESGAPDADLERIVELATAHSPLFATITCATRVTVERVREFEAR